MLLMAKLYIGLYTVSSILVTGFALAQTLAWTQPFAVLGPQMRTSAFGE